MDSATLTPTTIETESPFVISIVPTPFPTLPILLTPVTPDAVPPGADVIGLSVEGRAIWARTFTRPGETLDGARRLVFVGGMHGGYEANTIALITALIAHYEANAEAIPPGVALTLIPAANPDGVARGSGAAGRFNANGVDLNRNWSCEWTPNARWQDQQVDPGAAPFSEPETRAIAAYLRAARPVAAMFYHSAAGGVFAGNCGVDHGSTAVSALYGEAAGYAFGGAWTAYPVTGTAAAWADGEGIPAADIELATSTDTEIAANLRGIAALLAWAGG